MKKIALLFSCLFLVSASLLYAQTNTACTGHPLFSAMPNHSVRSCEEKDFDELEIYQKDATKGRIDFMKQGYKNAVVYKFDGEWAKRPSPLQICKNYVNAVQKAGGTVLYEAESYMYGKLKKGDGVYWIAVSADGSGDYKVASIREEMMKQDVVMTAAEIKGNIKEEGKAVFYGIYFDTDKSTLQPASAPTLTEIAKYLKENAAVNVFIVGHTDNTGDYSHNVQLSKERAAAVVNELVSKYAISKTRLTAEGVGPLAPTAGNTAEEGRKKNRRVELVLK
jgi:outer membrane protein OmpA-like peptidoglycan-associated protein